MTDLLVRWRMGDFKKWEDDFEMRGGGGVDTPLRTMGKTGKIIIIVIGSIIIIVILYAPYFDVQQNFNKFWI